MNILHTKDDRCLLTATRKSVRELMSAAYGCKISLHSLRSWLVLDFYQEPPIPQVLKNKLIPNRMPSSSMSTECDKPIRSAPSELYNFLPCEGMCITFSSLLQDGKHG